MAISSPCSWRNIRLEAGPRASGPPWCHGRTFVTRYRKASMLFLYRSYLCRLQFVAIILAGTSGKIHLVGLSYLLSSDAPSDAQPLASATRERRPPNAAVDRARRSH